MVYLGISTVRSVPSTRIWQDSRDCAVSPHALSSMSSSCSVAGSRSSVFVGVKFDRATPLIAILVVLAAGGLLNGWRGIELRSAETTTGGRGPGPRTTLESLAVTSGFGPLAAARSAVVDGINHAEKAIALILLPRPACGERVGVRGSQIAQYFLHHNFSLFQRIVIPEPHDAISLGFKICCSLRIRNDLLALGIVLKDSPTGTTWEVKR